MLMRTKLLVIGIIGMQLSLSADSIICNIPVTKCEPVYQTVVKKIPHKQCWNEQYSTPLCSHGCNNVEIIAKTTTVTKCKTTYTDKMEQVMVGYNHFGKACGGNTIIKKFSKCKLKFIRTTISY